MQGAAPAGHLLLRHKLKKERIGRQSLDPASFFVSFGQKNHRTNFASSEFHTTFSRQASQIKNPSIYKDLARECMMKRCLAEGGGGFESTCVEFLFSPLLITVTSISTMTTFSSIG
jgi:hypothetical protein